MANWYSLLGKGEVHKVTEEASIYSHYNPYGFIFNVNHPAVNKAYMEYKKEIGEATFPISNAQRFEFEKRVATGYYPELDKYIGKRD